jgi:hypothetical protein
MAEAHDELGSKCYEDTSSASKAKENARGCSSYQPFSNGGENIERLQDDVEILLGSLAK